jgi:hypothetical protein
MDEFISTLEETLDYKRKRKFDDTFTFEEKLEKLSFKLQRIARQLQKLVDAKATLENGNLFKYSVQKAVFGSNFGKYYIELNLPDCDAYIEYMRRGDGPYILSINHRMNGRTLEESADDDEILVDLAIFLGNKLGSLGMLDKEIYPKKVQDHLGI